MIFLTIFFLRLCDLSPTFWNVYVQYWSQQKNWNISRENITCFGWGSRKSWRKHLSYKMEKIDIWGAYFMGEIAILAESLTMKKKQ